MPLASNRQRHNNDRARSGNQCAGDWAPARRTHRRLASRAALRRFSRTVELDHIFKLLGRQDCFTRNPTTTYFLSSNNFEGKRVLVTGGTKGGIGETMVYRFTPGTDSVATVSA
jgi:FlaA1/EpsC-like NDP-sugar epimerase